MDARVTFSYAANILASSEIQSKASSHQLSSAQLRFNTLCDFTNFNAA